jgi:mannosyltransferase OCH1-like enzyme
MKRVMFKKLTKGFFVLKKILVICFIFIATVQAVQIDWEHDFKEELLEHLYKEKTQKEFFPFFKRVYEENHPDHLIDLQDGESIPKIIHQIWLGGSFPEKYFQFQKTWIEKHPDWEYKLWTEEDLPNFKLKNQKAFNRAKNYGEKANIWRYEILERFGGLYVDTDYECLKPFDEFIKKYTFFSGMCSLDRQALVSNALIACTAHHPIISSCVEKTNRLKWKNADKHQFYKNGIFFFERIIFEESQKLSGEELKRVIAFPPSVFYPGSKSNTSPKSCSYAIHYFDSLWLK